MVASFLDYSLGKLEKGTKRLMDMKMPGWPEKFWDKFSNQLQFDIKRVIETGGGGNEILRDIKKYVS